MGKNQPLLEGYGKRLLRNPLQGEPTEPLVFNSQCRHVCCPKNGCFFAVYLIQRVRDYGVRRRSSLNMVIRPSKSSKLSKSVMQRVLGVRNHANTLSKRRLRSVEAMQSLV